MSESLVELRLSAFKSLRDATVPLGGTTLLVGRNGSGKSNVLDGLAALAAMAVAPSLRDALDGGREGPLVRGGSEGCAPAGTDAFSLGCGVRLGEVEYHLDVDVVVSPVVQIRRERLWARRSGRVTDYLVSEPYQPDSSDIAARWRNARRGVNPPATFRGSQLLTAQVSSRVPASTEAGREVHKAAEAILNGLRSVFVLDPVPQQMREYVPERDSRLRRNAENLSAVIARLSRTPSTHEELVALTSSLLESQISDLGIARSRLGDVILMIDELLSGHTRTIPARLMSDGTLRFLAIAAAVLDDAHPTDASGSAQSSRLLVIEELENGLHPSQAELLLRRLRSSATSGEVRTLATTHSPAILDELRGDEHQNVLVCSRDHDGWSTVTRLTDFPDYFEVAGRSSLGRLATADKLRSSGRLTTKSPSLAAVLGL